MAKATTKTMQRLDKCVSHIFDVSRKQASALIKDGEVKVDGELITDPSVKIAITSVLSLVSEDPSHATDTLVAFDDDDTEAASPATSIAEGLKKRVFLLNKPCDFVCADRDKNHRIVASLFRDEVRVSDLHCAGRLDIDTSGLLIVTDDGDLNHAITSPKKQVHKLYLARLNKPVPEKAVTQFANGIKHPEETKRYQPAKLTILSNSDDEYLATVQLYEGRFHEVKRLFEMVGCEVTELSRLAIGTLTLPQKLKLGEYSALSAEQIAQLFNEPNFSEDELRAMVENYEQNLSDSQLTFLPERLKAQATRVEPQTGVIAKTASAAAATAASTKESDADEPFGLGHIINAKELLIEDGKFIEDEDADALESETDFDELDENGDIRIY